MHWNCLEAQINHSSRLARKEMRLIWLREGPDRKMIWRFAKLRDVFVKITSSVITITVTRSRWRLKRLRAEPPPVSEPRISQDYVIKGSCDIIGKSPSREAIILPSLVPINTLVIEIWWFLFAMWPYKTTWLKRKMTLRLGASQSMPSFYQLWWP